MGDNGSVNPAATQFLSAASGRLAFRRLGPTGEVPLLLCHRFRWTIDDWDPACAYSVAAAQELLDTLPFMKVGIMQVELVEVIG